MKSDDRTRITAALRNGAASLAAKATAPYASASAATQKLTSRADQLISTALQTKAKGAASLCSAMKVEAATATVAAIKARADKCGAVVKTAMQSNEAVQHATRKAMGAADCVAANVAAKAQHTKTALRGAAAAAALLVTERVVDLARQNWCLYLTENSHFDRGVLSNLTYKLERGNGGVLSNWWLYLQQNDV